MKNLEKKLSESLDKEILFIMKIKPKDRIVLIYDADVDGVSSAAIALSGLEKLGIKNIRLVHKDWKVTNNLSELVARFDKGIILDVPTPVIEKQLKKIRKDLLVIDHHPSKDVSSKNIVYINPRLKKREIYQPVSYLTYKIFSKIVDVTDKEWLAVVGTVGDYGFEDCKDLLRKYLEIKKKEDVWKTELGKTAMMINGAIAVLNPRKTLGILKPIKDLEEFKKNVKIKTASKRFDNEFERVKIEFKKNLEIYVDFGLIFSEIKPKFSRISSTLSTYIATKYPNKFIMIVERMNGNYKIHGRMENGKIHVGELLEKLCVGGGHREAGAGIVKMGEINRFKANLIRELANFTGKRR